MINPNPTGKGSPEGTLTLHDLLDAVEGALAFYRADDKGRDRWTQAGYYGRMENGVHLEGSSVIRGLALTQTKPKCLCLEGALIYALPWSNAIVNYVMAFAKKYNLMPRYKGGSQQDEVYDNLFAWNDSPNTTFSEIFGWLLRMKHKLQEAIASEITGTDQENPL